MVVFRQVCGCFETYPDFNLCATNASSGYFACPMLQSNIPTSCTLGSNTSCTSIKSANKCVCAVS